MQIDTMNKLTIRETPTYIVHTLKLWIPPPLLPPPFSDKFVKLLTGKYLGLDGAHLYIIVTCRQKLAAMPIQLNKNMQTAEY
jgi:hypothetical protein